MNSYITIAVGDHYNKLALDLKQSMKDHNWKSKLTIIGDGNHSDIYHSDEYRGRSGKTGFYKFLPEIDGDNNIILIDADCIVVGEEPSWEFDNNEILCVANEIFQGKNIRSKKLKRPINDVYPDAFFLVFKDKDIATKISKLWHNNWLRIPRPVEQRVLMSLASEHEFKIISGSSFGSPTKSIKHLSKNIKHLSKNICL